MGQPGILSDEKGNPREQSGHLADVKTANHGNRAGQVRLDPLDHCGIGRPLDQERLSSAVTKLGGDQRKHVRLNALVPTPAAGMDGHQRPRADRGAGLRRSAAPREYQRRNLGCPSHGLGRGNGGHDFQVAFRLVESRSFPIEGRPDDNQPDTGVAQSAPQPAVGIRHPGDRRVAAVQSGSKLLVKIGRSGKQAGQMPGLDRKAVVHLPARSQQPSNLATRQDRGRPAGECGPDRPDRGEREQDIAERPRMDEEDAARPLPHRPVQDPPPWVSSFLANSTSAGRFRLRKDTNDGSMRLRNSSST